jgi:nucleoid-associated protein YgaU
MSRSISLALAAFLSVAGGNLLHSQDAAPAPSTDDVTQLKAENAALKQQAADAAKTIAKLQAELAEDGKTHDAATGAPPIDAGTASTNAAPTGPLKALPLDSTNAAGTPGGPVTDAGPSRTYTVVKGDSIWKIAHKMYPGDTKNGVDKIQEANKDAIGGKPLKIGQVLTIPQ